MPTPKPNRWHPCLLPDDYPKKMRQTQVEAEAEVESRSKYVPDPDAPSPDDNQWPVLRPLPSVASREQDRGEGRSITASPELDSGSK